MTATALGCIKLPVIHGVMKPISTAGRWISELSTAYVAPNDILGGYGGTNLDPGATPKIH